MSRTRLLVAASVSIALAGCIEDETYGLAASPLELPRGATRPVAVAAQGAMPAASAFIVELDDPELATAQLSADGQRLELRALAEGTTTLHVVYRDTAVHVPTTILPAATVALVLSPGGVTAPIGGEVTLAALATNTADELVDVTARAVWTVDDPRVARLYSNGTLHAVAAGTTALRAEVDGIVQTAPVVIAP